MTRYLLLSLVLVLAACAGPTKPLENIPLVWKPEKEPIARMPSTDTGLREAKLKVAPMTDSRVNPKLIGESKVKLPVRTVTTADDVPAFVTERVKKLLAGAGMVVVESGETAVLNGDIQQYFVNETSDNYSGEVKIAFTVTDPAGNVRWQGVSQGTSTRIGRTYTEGNYYESLSDALSLATTSLLYDVGFQKAVTGRQ